MKVNEDSPFAEPDLALQTLGESARGSEFCPSKPFVSG